MKNKKGFTLVELLAVIVLLAVIITFGAVTVSSVRDKMLISTTSSKLDNIINNAKIYGDENIDLLPKEITVADLMEGGYLSSEDTDDDGNIIIKNDTNNKSLNSLVIEIKKVNRRAQACIKMSNNNTNLLSNSDFSDYYC